MVWKGEVLLSLTCSGVPLVALKCNCSLNKTYADCHTAGLTTTTFTTSSTLHQSPLTRGKSVQKHDNRNGRKVIEANPSRQPTPAHASLQYTATARGSSQHIATAHDSSRQFTTAHNSSRQFTTAHDSSRQLQIGHGSSTQLVTSQDSSKQLKTAHDDSRSLKAARDSP